MLVSMKWLESMVEVPDDLQGFCDRLDLTGTGVEGVDKIGNRLDGVKIGYVETCIDHPDSDHMHVTSVDLGDGGDPVQIVCGAPNIRSGIKVAVATIGCVLPEGQKIKKSKLRGQVSCGMICSERELALGSDHEGIMVLPEDAPVGEDFATWKGVVDTVLDLEITPNRPDCLSMKGFAREVGAIYDVVWRYEPPIAVPGPECDERVDDSVCVEIEESELCPRYTARLIRGVHIGPSPQWLVERITALGARPINNVVDATNYILFELGQPLHAFDLRAFPKGKDGKHHVVVRRASDGQTFTTLDGVERTLTSDMTLITNGDNAVALAGVMGGLDSEVVDDTCDILLESATFSCGHTSRTSRNLSLVSEASLRYERGVDASTCDEFGEIAAALIAEVAGGEVCKGLVDVYPLPVEEPHLTLRPDRLREHVGAEITNEEQARILTNLGCKVEDNGDGVTMSIAAPTFRPDLTREIDLYEEVLRIWGMDRVEPTLPGGAHAGGRTKAQSTLLKIDSILRACGLCETMTYSLVAKDDLDKARIPQDKVGEAVELINPMSEEQSVMRRTIIPGLLRSVAYNQAHGVDNVQLFERGVVFSSANGRKNPKEHMSIAGMLAGSFVEDGWNQKAQPVDFFDAKGIVETLMHELAVPKIRFKAMEAQDSPWLCPGRAAEVLSGGRVLGWVGELHPLSCEAFEIKGTVAAFELDAAQIIEVASDSRPFVDVPIYPNVEADLAIVVDEDVSAERLVQCIQSAGKKGSLESVRLFDVYRDDARLGEGKKSMAFRLSYRASDRTLTSDEVEKAHKNIVDKLVRATGGEIRS